MYPEIVICKISIIIITITLILITFLHILFEGHGFVGGCWFQNNIQITLNSLTKIPNKHPQQNKTMNNQHNHHYQYPPPIRIQAQNNNPTALSSDQTIKTITKKNNQQHKNSNRMIKKEGNANSNLTLKNERRLRTELSREKQSKELKAIKPKKGGKSSKKIKTVVQDKKNKVEKGESKGRGMGGKALMTLGLKNMQSSSFKTVKRHKKLSTDIPECHYIGKMGKVGRSSLQSVKSKGKIETTTRSFKKSVDGRKSNKILIQEETFDNVPHITSSIAQICSSFSRKRCAMNTKKFLANQMEEISILGGDSQNYFEENQQNTFYAEEQPSKHSALINFMSSLDVKIMTNLLKDQKASPYHAKLRQQSKRTSISHYDICYQTDLITYLHKVKRIPMKKLNNSARMIQGWWRRKTIMPYYRTLFRKISCVRDNQRLNKSEKTINKSPQHLKELSFQARKQRNKIKEEIPKGGLQPEEENKKSFQGKDNGGWGQIHTLLSNGSNNDTILQALIQQSQRNMQLINGEELDSQRPVSTQNRYEQCEEEEKYMGEQTQRQQRDDYDYGEIIEGDQKNQTPSNANIQKQEERSSNNSDDESQTYNFPQPDYSTYINCKFNHLISTNRHQNPNSHEDEDLLIEAGEKEVIISINDEDVDQQKIQKGDKHQLSEEDSLQKTNKEQNLESVLGCARGRMMRSHLHTGAITQWIVNCLLDQFSSDISALLAKAKGSSKNAKKLEIEQRQSGILTDVKSIESYLDNLIGFLLKEGQEDYRELVMRNMGHSLGLKGLEILKIVRQSDEDQELSSSDDQWIFAIPSHIFEDIEEQCNRDLKGLDPKQGRKIELYRQFWHRSIFQCLNQCLDYERPFGVNGAPYPWCPSTTTFKASRLPPKSMSRLPQILNRAKNRLLGYSMLPCGIIFDKPSDHYSSDVEKNMHRLSQDLRFEMNDDRMSSMLAHQLNEQGQWITCQNQMVDVLCGVSSMLEQKLFVELITEMKMLNRLMGIPWVQTVIMDERIPSSPL